MPSVLLVKTAARRLLNEQYASFWLDTDLEDWVTQAAYDISTRTYSVETVDYISLLTGIDSYTPATAFLRVDNIYYAAAGKTLRKTTPLMRGFQTAIPTGPPEYFYDYASKIWLFPTPTLAENGQILTAFFAKETNDITLISGRFYMSAVIFVVAMGLIKERQTTKALQMFNLYIASLSTDISNLLTQKFGAPALDSYNLKQTEVQPGTTNA
jgi:hypothetical protein